MLYLSGRDLADAVSPTILIAAIEQGLRDFALNKTVVPVRQHVNFADNTLLTMSAIAERVFGTKTVSVVPSNASRGLPVTNGLMTLSDGVTGMPIAILDAAMLTAQRTGAVGALGLKYTTPNSVNSIGVIGTGVQGTWQAIFACAVRTIHTVYFVSRSDESAQRFVDAVSRRVPVVRFSRCVDAEDILTKTNVVITATTSKDPVLPDDRQLLENKHFISIGSFKSSMKELPHSVYQIARQVVVDSDAAKIEAGDLIEPLSLGILHDEDIIHIADLVAGKRSLETDRTTVFKSVGMALYDLYAASAFLAEAKRSGRGTPLDTSSP
jgi:ornithine cyclodeaminase/alanine dehydrogenase-like protein (mu-crystallin family)